MSVERMSQILSETITAATGESIENTGRPVGTPSPIFSNSNTDSNAHTKVDDSDWVLRKISTLDSEYVKKHLGIPLSLALSEIVNRRPSDPIHYLGHWLLKWRWNQEQKQMEEDKVHQLLADRRRIEEEIEEQKRLEQEKIEQALRDLRIEAEIIARDLVNRMCDKLELPDLPEPVVPEVPEVEPVLPEEEDEWELGPGGEALPRSPEDKELGEAAGSAEGGSQERPSNSILGAASSEKRSSDPSLASSVTAGAPYQPSFEATQEVIGEDAFEEGGDSNVEKN